MVKTQAVAQGLTIPVQSVVNDTYKIYDMKPKMLKNDFHVLNVKVLMEHRLVGGGVTLIWAPSFG